MRVQHNIMAMNAYRNLSNNNSALSKNLEKLSSGYKINRAGDDAAGLAISEKMRAQITGLDTAQKNVKDGISLVQTAEGALTEVHDMLNRMVELANQSANGTYADDVDRENLQAEIDQLKDEIDRIADSSNFNGINLLDGSQQNNTAVTNTQDAVDKGILKVLSDGQLGTASQAGVFELDLSNFKATTSSDDGSITVKILGQDLDLTFNTGTDVSGADLAKAITNAWNDGTARTEFSDKDTSYGVNINASVSADGNSVIFTMDSAPVKAWDQAADVEIKNFKVINNAQDYQLKVTTQPVDTTDVRKYAEASLNLKTLGIADGTVLTIGDSSYTFAVGSDSSYKNAANVVDLTDIESGDITKKIGVIANRLTEVAQNNSNFKISTKTQTGQSAEGLIYLVEKEGGVDTNNYKLKGKDNATNDKDGDWKGLVSVGKYDAKNSTSALRLQIGDTSDSFNQLNVSISDTHTDSLGIKDIDISTQQGAADAVDVIKKAINTVSSIRGTLGAAQNRLEHTQNNLSVMEENITDAESTIRDTDIAEEMMAYTKNNILIQSAQAMLAQANQVPQGVLQLMG